MKNACGVLGVTKTATPDEIRNAYGKLAKKLQPDLNPGVGDINDQVLDADRQALHLTCGQCTARAVSQ